ncbi:MAG TPA: OadG family protein [Clostridiales bacterium]|jgi:sodium pump decarboxylase gamma subunit|nr:OadG family protein [Clostridiales bacterium]
MTLADIFSKAILHTMLGMGVVFAVLVFIISIISLFKYLPGLLDKEPKADREGAYSAGDATLAAGELLPASDLSEDLQLIAVITASVLACSTQDAGSGDAYRVRSIRRV